MCLGRFVERLLQSRHGLVGDALQRLAFELVDIGRRQADDHLLPHPDQDIAVAGPGLHWPRLSGGHQLIERADRERGALAGRRPRMRALRTTMGRLNRYVRVAVSPDGSTGTASVDPCDAAGDCAISTLHSSATHTATTAMSPDNFNMDPVTRQSPYRDELRCSRVTAGSDVWALHEGCEAITTGCEVELAYTKVLAFLSRWATPGQTLIKALQVDSFEGETCQRDLVASSPARAAPNASAISPRAARTVTFTRRPTGSRR